MAHVFADLAPEHQVSSTYRYGVPYLERKLPGMPRTYGYWRQEHTNAVARLLSDAAGATFQIVDPATGHHPRALDHVNEVDIVLETAAAKNRFFASAPWPGPLPSIVSTELYGQLSRPCRNLASGALGPFIFCMTTRFMERWPNSPRDAGYQMILAKHQQLMAGQQEAEQKAIDEEAEEEAAAVEAQRRKKTTTMIAVGVGGAVVLGALWALSRRR